MTQRFQPTSLARDLADQDARQLLDIGLVRAADGSLRLASDPSQPVGPERPSARWRRFAEALARLGGYLRNLPFRSRGIGPIFFIRE